MPITNPLNLLEFVESLGLITATEAETLRAEWSDDDSVTTTAHALDRLVERRFLTNDQARRLLHDESLVIGDRYQIIQLLGAGGMGSVFLANDQHLNRKVALKILPPKLVDDAGAVARFERESKAMAHLGHPHIVRAHGAGSDDDQHYLVMEYVEGTALNRLLKERGAIQPTTAADYAYQTALGLDHAHLKGLVHRDLKPANLIITKDDQVKILDLGLARFMQDQIHDETLTLEGAGLGTPDYMAPEQFGQARHADERSDVYSLGCTLYHMLTGRVPFPGSSLSEKCQSHQQSQPEPMQKLVRGVPAGLSQAVEKMMAKRPQDRFQSAQECADALLPYVDASSESLPNLQATTDWQGSQFRIMTARSRRQRKWKWAATGAAMIVVGLILGFGFSTLLPSRNATEVAKDQSGKTTDDAKSTSITTDASDNEPWLLTVSREATAGGRYRTIAAALENVRPGMTIRILDDATYAEVVSFNDANRHAGLTLESTGQAIIQAPDNARYAIQIVEVPDVTIRDLQIVEQRVDSSDNNTNVYYSIAVGRASPGVMIDGVEFIGGQSGLWAGVGIESLPLSEDDAPVVVADCIFRDLIAAVRIVGSVGTTPPVGRPSRRIVVRDNQISGGDVGIWLGGQLSDVHVVGNRIVNSGLAGIQLQAILSGTDRVLIANNTIENSEPCLRVDEPLQAGTRVQIRNNLLLATQGPDLAFYGNDAQALQSWQIGNNVRRVANPAQDTDIWLLSSDDSDRFVESVQLAGTLRVAANSPWATQGAGVTDPSLPRYAGALPPEDAAAWDWTRTWQAPPGTGRLLTVSRERQDGGQYRSVVEALAACQPWDTIRVLDGGTYNEPLDLNDSARHRGIVLDGNGASVDVGSGVRGFMQIANVSEVRCRGWTFRARDEGNPPLLIRVLSESTGVVLENLHFDVESPTECILLQNIRVHESTRPLTVRRCTFQSRGLADQFSDLIQLSAAPDTESFQSAVLIHDNTIVSGGRAIALQGQMANVLVAGNRITGCAQSGLQITDIAADASNILFANNTVSNCYFNFRYWNSNTGDESIGSSKVRFANNVLFGGTEGDFAFLQQTPMSVTFSPELKNAAMAVWKFEHNYRDYLATQYGGIAPLGPTDQKLENFGFASTDPSDSDFFRPAEDSPLVQGGVAGDLPGYAGARPPENTAAWNWQRTWRTQVIRNRHYQAPASRRQ